MKNDRGFKSIAVVAICIGIVCISIAYAALNSSLTITGTAGVSATDTSWEIAFTNVKNTSTTGGVTVTTAPSATATTNLTWAAAYKAPKSSYTFTATITNSGTIPAKLESGTYLGTTGTASSNFDYTVTIDGTSIENYGGYVWAAGASKDIIVTVTFDKNGTLSSEELTALNTQVATFTLNLPFVQATDAEVTAATTGNKIFN